MVVLYHLGGAIASEKYFGIKAFSIPFSFGHAGVPFFFVLSGFIIISAHRNDICKPQMLAGYLRKRFARIYPAYWIVFLSVFFLAIASTTLRNSVPHDAFLVLKSLLLIPQDAKALGGTGAPVIDVAWTLQYEMVFYMLFASLILSRWLSMIVGGALLFIYISNVTGVLSYSFPLSFLSQDYMLLFAMGMSVSEAHRSRKVIASNPVFLASLGALMFLFIALNAVIGIHLAKETLLYGLASCLMVFGLVRAEDAGRIFLGHSWMQKLGNSSYALYLIHYPLISILCKLALIVQLNTLGITGAMIAYLAIFYTCLGSSVVFHLWVERPVAAYFRNRRTNHTVDV